MDSVAAAELGAGAKLNAAFDSEEFGLASAGALKPNAGFCSVFASCTGVKPNAGLKLGDVADFVGGEAETTAACDKVGGAAIRESSSTAFCAAAYPCCEFVKKLALNPVVGASSVGSDNFTADVGCGANAGDLIGVAGFGFGDGTLFLTVVILVDESRDMMMDSTSPLLSSSSSGAVNLTGVLSGIGSRARAGSGFAATFVTGSASFLNVTLFFIGTRSTP